MKHRWYKGLVAALTLVVCWIALPVPDCAVADSSVVVLGAQTKKAHRQFVEGFKKYLDEQQDVLEFIDIALGDDMTSTDGLRDIIQQHSGPLILTLGPKALRSVLQQDVDRPVLAGLTHDASALEKNAGATGVVLEYKVATELAWIRRILPEVKAIGVLYNPAENGQRITVAKKAAKKLGLNLIAQEVNSPSELPVAMDSLFRRIDVLWGIKDPVVLSRQTAKAVLLTSFRNKVPFIAPSSAWVKAGALYSLDVDYKDIGVQTGEMAWSVIKGQQVSTMPPQEPRKVRYSLNLRTAQHMKLSLPGEIVDKAAQVFE